MGAGSFAVGLFSGLTQSVAESRERKERLKMIGAEGAMARLSGMMKDPAFTSDPQALKDITDAQLAVIADIQGTGGRDSKGKKQDPFAHASQAIHAILGNVYKGNEAQPGYAPALDPRTKQQVAPGSAGAVERKGPFIDLEEKQRRTEIEKKQIEEQSFVRRQQTLIKMKEDAKAAADAAAHRKFEELIAPGPGQVTPFEAWAWTHNERTNPFKPATDKASKPVQVQLKNGEVVPANRMFDGSIVRLGGGPIDPSEIKDANYKPAAARPDTHELAYKAYAEKHNLEPDKLTAVQRVNAIKEYTQAVKPPKAGDGGKEARRAGNAKAIADAIERGSDSPDLARLYGMSGDIRAELDRRGYDLAKAQLDWKATNSWISSQNAQAQLRIRQATEFAFESLDLIDQLNDNLSTKLGSARSEKYPRWNKAALAAAREGLLGKESQQAANNLEIQIADLQAEIATVYKGGNSPTDIGLKRAQDILSGNWTRETLKSAVELSRTNLKYRLNSIRNTGVAGATGTNKYMEGRIQPPEDVAKPDAKPPIQPKDLKKGQRVRLKNGRTVTVTTVRPDGSFDYE